MNPKKTIMLTGGGTLGSVTPLLGVHEAWKKRDPDQDFVWVGTYRGPERELVAQAGIPFVPFLVPKAYRYFTWKWFVLPFLLLWSLLTAAVLLWRFRPAWIISAGAFVSVPLAWLAPLFGTRVAIHQLDYVPGLANVLMAPVASLVTSTWSITQQHLPKKTVHVVGGLAYGAHLRATSRREAFEHFDLDPTKPTVLILGGGLGAEAINHAVEGQIDKLTQEVNVLHATGRGKRIMTGRALHDYYGTELFVDDFGQALGIADVVVTRAGLGTLLELVQKKKAAILVPLPRSPQEANAEAVESAGAAVVLKQHRLDQDLLKTVREILEPDRRRRLEAQMGSLFPTDGAEAIINLIEQKNTPE